MRNLGGGKVSTHKGRVRGVNAPNPPTPPPAPPGYVPPPFKPCPEAKTGKTPCDKKSDNDTGNKEPSSYKKGGRVKRTGNAKLHKDEVVLPVALVKQLQKLMKK